MTSAFGGEPRESGNEELNGGQRKVLFITREPLWGLISPFLVRMGCVCSRVASSALDVILEREMFDAAFLDADHPEIPAEQALSRIQKMRPSLFERMLVIRRSAAEPEMIEVIDRHDLQRVSDRIQIEGLWSALQNVFPSSHKAELALLTTPAARLVVDSYRSSAPAGIRGPAIRAQQLLYEHGSATIDLLIEPRDGPGGVLIIGQVLDRRRRTENGRVLVLLVTGSGNRAQTSTNQFGEFRLACESLEPGENPRVEVRLGKGMWVSLPIGTSEEAEATAELESAAS